MKVNILRNKFLIYGLVDPRDGQLRYIGKSCSGLKRPRSEYSRVLKKYEGAGHRQNWIKSLYGAGLKYEIVILQSFIDDGILEQAEIFWIAYFRKMGCSLTNLTDGGGGCSGYRHTKEALRRLSEINKGKRPSTECIEASRRANLGRFFNHTEKSKRKISESKLGNSNGPFSDEARINTSLAHGGRRFRDQRGNIYNSLSEARIATGVDRTSISRVLRGTYLQANGFIFKFC